VAAALQSTSLVDSVGLFCGGAVIVGGFWDE
jgi:hypothetical protein